MLTSIEINAQPAKHSIIWLHGLGADGHDFFPIAAELQLPASCGVRFVFPDAPVMPVTINNGYKMRAWYDIKARSIEQVLDISGMEKSVHAVEQLVQREEALGIASENIVIAGFSQGAVIALYLGLQCVKPLAGILALSGYLPQSILEKASAANQKTPIFLGHGIADDVVPSMLGQMAHNALKQAGYPVSWHQYPIQHGVCPEEIKDIRYWLLERFMGPVTA